jgi:hypothetical protein
MEYERMEERFENLLTFILLQDSLQSLCGG